MDNFVAGIIVMVALGALALGIYDMGRVNTYSDLRDQCERQGSIRLGKGAMFYCAREPQK